MSNTLSVSRPTNGFAQMPDGVFADKVDEIMIAMTGNEIFPDPVPALAVIAGVQTDYKAALALARLGNRFDINAKDVLKTQLVGLMHQLSNYVQLAANSDREKIISSGYTVNKLPQPRPVPTQPVNQKVVNGENRGDVIFSFKRVPGVIVYNYQATPEPLTPHSVWETKRDTKSKTVFQNLESGKRYWFRVIVIGRKGQELTSNPVDTIVL